MLNNANAVANVAVKNLDAAKKFYHDTLGLTRQGDIHLGGDMKVAWFKDPDGNILNLVNR